MIRLGTILSEIRLLSNNFPKNIKWYYVVKNEEDLDKVLKKLKSLGYIFGDGVIINIFKKMFPHYKTLTNVYSDDSFINSNKVYWGGKECSKENGYIELSNMLSEIKLIDKKTSNFIKNKSWRILVSNMNEWENLKKILKKLNYRWHSGKSLDSFEIDFFPTYVGYHLQSDHGIFFNYDDVPPYMETLNSNLIK